MDIISVPVSSLRSDPNNARLHGPENLAAIAGSLSAFGQRTPLRVRGDVVIAGNGTLEAAISLGWETIEVTQVPVDWSDEQARAYALADNRTSELAEWDLEVLSDQLVSLELADFDVDFLSFANLPNLPESPELDDDDIYTDKITNLIYEIKGDRPSVLELYDDVKACRLRADIVQAELPVDVEAFLVAATYRHVVFNYERVAEFYAHADKQTQKLFEDSALVIIDYDDAIRQGFVRVNDAIDRLQKSAQDD